MPRDKKESHEKVIKAALEEFVEFGYEKASMRRIGRKCGMTAAGLYRHFASKEAMFEALVKPAVVALEQWMEEHIERSLNTLHNRNEDLWGSTEINMMRDVVYPRMAEFRLLLNCAKGSRYETFLHDLVTEHQKKFENYLPLLKEQGYKVKDISSNEMHLLLTAYTSALFEPVIHDYSQEEALRCLDTVEAFFIPGWKQMMGF